MALIQCPECGREISDRAKSCPHCGFPVEELEKQEKVVPRELPEDQRPELFECYKCGRKIPVGIVECPFCKYLYGTSRSNLYEQEKEAMSKELEFRGLFTLAGNGRRKNRYKKICPRCKSDNVHAFVEMTQVSGEQTEAQYSANLNPLKPFTLFNKREKVTRGPQYKKISRFQCDDCGKIFS